MSSTPITDKYEVCFSSLCAPEDAMWVSSKVVRELEHKLAAANLEVKECSQVIGGLKAKLNEAVSNIDKLQTAVAHNLAVIEARKLGLDAKFYSKNPTLDAKNEADSLSVYKKEK